MSGSLHIDGIRPPNDRFEQMFQIYATCTAAGIEVPREVVDFFNGDTPDPAGVVLNLNYPDSGGSPLREWSNDHQEGYEFNVADVPADVTVLRVYMSY